MKALLAATGLAALLLTSAASAAVSDEDFQELKQMLEQALDRIDELEQQPSQKTATAETVPAEQVAANTARLEKLSWAERIKLKGDFRYRYQPEEAKGLLDGANQPLNDTTRNRQRIRARLAVAANLGDNLEVGLGVATGGDDPVSSNQTLGGGGSSKDIKLDLAYADWGFAEGANLALGKFKNHFIDVASGGFVWDSDWRPEGFDLRIERGIFYAAGLVTWLEADSKNGSSFSYTAQAGFQPSIGDTKLRLGAGYTHTKSKDELCYDSPSEGRGDACFGNTEVDGTGQVAGSGGMYAMDYSPVEVFAKADFSTPLPVSVFADFVRNVDAKAISSGPSAGNKLDSAYLVGASVGKAKQRGGWAVKAYYQEKEADSMLGLLTDSDFAGGGTDSKGVVVKGKYMLTDNTYFQASYLRGERQDSNGYENGSAATANPYDVNVWQFDVQFKYK